METQVQSIPKRDVTFSVSAAEAVNITRWLTDALAANINTPASRDGVMKIRKAFQAVAEGEEFRG